MTSDQQDDRLFGKYPGIVVNNQASDGKQRLGELVVKVPGILVEGPNGKPDQPLETIAKPAFHPGFFFIPDKDANVWVEFVAGDMNFPVWTGVWFPKGATPKTHDGKIPNENHKIIRTSSGHLVELDDTKDAEKLIISDKENKNQVRFDSKGIKLSDGNGNTITLNDKGITLNASGAKIIMEAGAIKMTDGTGKLQFVVLEDIFKWLENHNHTGNFGAPTPAFPADKVILNAEIKSGTIKSGK